MKRRRILVVIDHERVAVQSEHGKRSHRARWRARLRGGDVQQPTAEFVSEVADLAGGKRCLVGGMLRTNSFEFGEQSFHGPPAKLPSGGIRRIKDMQSVFAQAQCRKW